jgi:mRNA-degrading endonuclease toxin of MazEF toxin-antitoxin module
VEVPPPPETVGHEQYGRRPYIIMSRGHINDRVKSVVGIPFTASENVLSSPQPPYRIFVPAKEITKDISYTGEIRDSVAKTDQVRVLDKARLEKKIGRLTNTAIASVGLGLAYLFDIR